MFFRKCYDVIVSYDNRFFLIFNANIENTEQKCNRGVLNF